MSQETQTLRRVRRIFRVLSILTFLEGGLGLFATLVTIRMGRIHFEALEYLLGYKYPHGWLVYAIECVNFSFCVVLFAVAALLWKQQRRGLFRLVCVLAAEFLYCVVFAMAFVGPRGDPALFKAHGYITGMAMMPFSLQIVTAFPVIAGILIFFAYRYIGIPARSIDRL